MHVIKQNSDGSTRFESEKSLTALKLAGGMPRSLGATFTHSAEAAGAADSIDTTIVLTDAQGVPLTEIPAGFGTGVAGVIVDIWTSLGTTSPALHSSPPDDIVAVSGCMLITEHVANHLAKLRFSALSAVFRTTKTGAYVFRLCMQMPDGTIVQSASATLA